VKRTGPVQIVEYSAEWPFVFETEGRLLRALFLPERVEIEHIGSTAVVGMAAKPIVDILLGAPSLESIERRIPALESRGYLYVGEFEVQLPRRRYFVKPAEREAMFHLHAVESGSTFWRDHVKFRDVLRTDRRVFDDYLALKLSLAKSLKMGRDAYTEAKGPFIASIINGK